MTSIRESRERKKEKKQTVSSITSLNIFGQKKKQLKTESTSWIKCRKNSLKNLLPHKDRSIDKLGANNYQPRAIKLSVKLLSYTYSTQLLNGKLSVRAQTTTCRQMPSVLPILKSSKDLYHSHAITTTASPVIPFRCLDSAVTLSLSSLPWRARLGVTWNVTVVFAPGAASLEIQNRATSDDKTKSNQPSCK